MYTEDITASKDNAGTISRSSFIKMWWRKFKNVIIPKVNYIQIRSSDAFTVLLSFIQLSFIQLTKAAVEKCTIKQFARMGKWYPYY